MNSRNGRPPNRNSDATCHPDTLSQGHDGYAVTAWRLPDFTQTKISQAHFFQMLMKGFPQRTGTMPVNHANFLTPLQQGIIQKLFKTRQHLLHSQPVHVDLTPPPASPRRMARGHFLELIPLPDWTGATETGNGDIQTDLVNFNNRS